MTPYRTRRATSIENEAIRVTVLHEGGHIAEITDKTTGINPLWTPPWPSIEPSAYDGATHAGYGQADDARLLAGIMGHNLCLDIFGGPSPEEAAAGLPVHGETSTASFDVAADAGAIVMSAVLPAAQLRVERRLRLENRRLEIVESVENLSAADRPVGWTQHVTIGPPFLERGTTRLHAPLTRSRVFDGACGRDDYLVAGAEFEWPLAPRRAGGVADLRVFTGTPASSGYTAHLIDPQATDAFFIAYSPASRLALGYGWRRDDFPWLGIWEENHSRTAPPWNARTLTRGLEFGVSPIPETRRQMIERGRLFDTPTFRWIPARKRVTVEYRAVLWPAGTMPDALPG